jgi:chemotaxis signal transduction protein
MTANESAAGARSAPRALELLVFDVGAEELALELGCVRQVRASGRAAAGELPVIDLRARLGLAPSLRPQRLVIAGGEGGQAVGLLVDRIGEVLHLSEEMVQAPSESGVAERIGPESVAGVAALGDRAIVVLSLSGLLPHGGRRLAA